MWKMEIEFEVNCFSNSMIHGRCRVHKTDTLSGYIGILRQRNVKKFGVCLDLSEIGGQCPMVSGRRFY